MQSVFMSSREKLDMDQPKNTTPVSFKHQKGCFIQRWILIVLLAAAVFSLIIVGLLVAYLAPCKGSFGFTYGASTLDGDTPAKPKLYVILPKSVVPEHYDIELQPYLIQDNFTFDGQVKIQIRVTEATHNVTLHVNDIKVHRDTVQLYSTLGDSVPTIESVSEDRARQFYVLHLSDSLKAGHRYQVEMRYVGVLNDRLNGFYRSSYTDKFGNKRWLATTQFQPTDARRAFPCFDEPALKATFNITLVHWPNMTSLSNMRIYKTEERGTDWIADYYETTVRMSTYLLAFIVSDFKGIGTKEFSVWSREEAIETAKYALDIGPRILKFFENFFNVSYPLPKMDMVAIPDFSAGAMENWGLITYREAALLFDSRYSSSRNKQRIATVVSHELAHQWFGNLVTPKWWDDLWLNEGFASYIEYLGIASVHPDWMMDQQFVVEDLQDVMDLDCLKSSHPISVPVNDPDEINEIFDRISYGKGASIIRMMMYFLGNRTFETGLSNYLNAKRFDNAVQDDLWSYLTAAQTTKNRINVKTVMDSWTLQTGYPVLTITRDYSKGSAKLEQTRFLLDRSSSEQNKSASWEIPLTYTHGQNANWEPSTKVWLHKTNGTINGLPGSEHWVVANLQQVGFYKVNYDLQNWQKLVEQLNTDHEKIHTINRAQILDDTMDLAKAELLSYHLALNATLYLRKEKEYIPWESFFSSCSYTDSMLSRTAIYGKWKKYLIKQLEPAYNWLGWTETENETILRQYLRTATLSWMCTSGHKGCIRMAQSMFEKWRQNATDLSIIPPNLRSSVYCIAVRYGDEDTWDFVWSRYLEAKVASDKDKLMYSLSCAKDPWLLSRYLEWSLAPDTGIRRQDGSKVFSYVGGKLYGRDLTFNFMRDKWSKIQNLYGKSFFAIGSLLKSVTVSLNTQFELDQLKDFYLKTKNNVGAAKRAFEQSIETAEANVRWMNANYESVKTWLDELEGL